MSRRNVVSVTNGRWTDSPARERARSTRGSSGSPGSAGAEPIGDIFAADWDFWALAEVPLEDLQQMTLTAVLSGCRGDGGKFQAYLRNLCVTSWRSVN